MKHQIELGKTTAPYAYVIPADQRKQRRRRRPHQHRPARRRGHQRRVVARSRSAAPRSRPATTSRGWTSRIAASSRCTSGMQWYPPTNPRPYDDTGLVHPAAAQHQGRSRRRQGDPRSADDDDDREREGHRVDHRHGRHDRDRSHHRQRADDVPLQERVDEDVGGRAGVRPGRPSLRARRVRDPERQPRGARAADPRHGPAGVGDPTRAERADARADRAAHRLHPLVAEHAG